MELNRYINSEELCTKVCYYEMFYHILWGFVNNETLSSENEGFEKIYIVNHLATT